MNENDENSAVATTRLTRSKSAAFGEDSTSGAKKPLQSKKTTINNQPLRKRAALGDVSNVTKGETLEGKKNVGKVGLVSKASQPTGIQKNVSRTNSTRSALGAKDNNKKAEPKRTGSGVLAGKRKTSSTSSNPASIKEETPAEDEQPSRKKIHIEVEQRITVEQEYKEEAIPDEVVEESVKQQFAEGVEDLEERTWTTL